MLHAEFDERKVMFRHDVPVKVCVDGELRDVLDIDFDGENVIIQTEDVE